MSSNVEYDYDEVIRYCKGEGQSEILQLATSLNLLADSLASCQEKFHSKDNTGIIGYIYNTFAKIIGSTESGTGLARLDKEAANLLNVCYSEAMNDKQILEEGIDGAGFSFGPGGFGSKNNSSGFNFKFPMSNEIAQAAKNMGFTDEQILIAVGISRGETGNFTSGLSVNNNNFGGMRSGGGWASFATKEEGITAFLQNLKKNYFDQGLNTVETIQPKYAPNSENDGSAWIKLIKGCMS